MPSVWSRLLPTALRTHLALRVHRDAVARRERALESPVDAQGEALQRLLRENQQSEFGRTHGFADIADLAQYRARVAVRSHCEYAPLLHRQAAGDDALVSGAIAALSEHAEPMSPLYPLSRAGLAQWQWWEALLQDYAIRHDPGVIHGPWLNLIPSRPPWGAKEDGGLRRGERWRLLGPSRAGAEHDPLPPTLWEMTDEDDRYYLALRLALASPLRALRAETPGALSILADQLEAQADALIDHLAAGVIRPKGSYEGVITSCKAQPERAKALAERRRVDGQLLPHHVWPQLKLLICEKGGAARAAAERLPDRYGNMACIDPGIVVAGAPLTTASHDGSLGGHALLDGQFIELEPVAGGDALSILDGWSLRPGQRCTVVVSCHNGLYRYRSGRLVEVTEVDAGGTPRLIAAGRREARVEIHGQYIVESDVQHAQREACRALDVLARHQLCFVETLDRLPDISSDAADRPIWSRLFSREPTRPLNPNAPHLCWVIEPAEPLAPEQGRKLLAHFEAALRHQSSTFDSLRDEQILGLALLTLRRGSFARRIRRRLADGLPGGHTPLGALIEAPIDLTPNEIDRRVV